LLSGWDLPRPEIFYSEKEVFWNIFG